MTDRSVKTIGEQAERIEAETVDAFKFPIEMTEIGPQYVIPGCERPAAPKTNGGATHD